jgi:hypothetical protein
MYENCGNGTSGKLVQINNQQNESPRASSCIELSEIRKLDSLLNQCESISCDNLLLFDDLYNYELCKNYKRKSLSTTAINKVPPKNSIKRRTHKKLLGIRENDKKIIKFIDDKKAKLQIGDEDKSSLENLVNSSKVTQSCTNLVFKEIERCDKIIQTSSLDLDNNENKTKSVPATEPTTKACKSPIQKLNPNPTKPCQKTSQKKQCTCRDYMCETSLTIPQKTSQHPSPASLSSTATAKTNANPTATSKLINNKNSANAKKPSLIKRDNSSENNNNKSFSKFGRLTKQKNTMCDDDNDEHVERERSSENNRIININEACIEIIPISTDPGSPPTSPRFGTGTDAKSEKSETQSQKSKRSKFSPSFISRKLTSRLNSEEDNKGGACESLLGRNKSVEKKLPEPVETVCTFLFNISMIFFVRFCDFAYSSLLF